jgi:hypothetical protein
MSSLILPGKVCSLALCAHSFCDSLCSFISLEPLAAFVASPPTGL